MLKRLVAFTALAAAGVPLWTGLVLVAIAPARADTLAFCDGLPGERVIESHVTGPASAGLDHNVTTTTPNSTFAGSEFCSAAADYGLLRANAHLDVTFPGAGFSSAAIVANASFSDLVTYTAPGSGNAFLEILGVFDGVIGGVDFSGQLFARGDLTLTATAITGSVLAERTVGGNFVNGPVSGNCCLDEIVVPIQLGTGSFNLSAQLNAGVAALKVGTLSANFSNTARITSVQLVDSNGNSLGPVTLTGASGFTYGASAPGPVPEPGSMTLFGLGLGVTMLRAHRLSRHRVRSLGHDGERQRESAGRGPHIWL